MLIYWHSIENEKNFNKGRFIVKPPISIFCMQWNFTMLWIKVGYKNDKEENRFAGDGLWNSV